MKKSKFLLTITLIFAILFTCACATYASGDLTIEDPEPSPSPSVSPEPSPEPSPSPSPSPEPSPSPSPSPEPSPSPSPSPTPEDGQWTDFEDAKFELTKNGVAGATLVISNVNLNDMHSYYAYISSSNSKPDINKDSEHIIPLGSSENNKGLQTHSDELARNIELNQDLYLSILEDSNSSKYGQEVVSYGNKLTRYDEPQYTDAFFATFTAYDKSQIITTYTHSQENSRKMQIKIGKIDDVNILKNIKNKKSNAFSDLLSYAKKTNGLFDKTLDCSNHLFLEYDNDKEGLPLNVTDFVDEAYYFMYIKTNDDGGKYLSHEAVTLAQASTPVGHWFLHYYGADNFKWADFGESNSSTDDKKDDTIAPDKEMPKTGESAIIITTIGLITLITVLSINRFKKYKDAK